MPTSTPAVAMPAHGPEHLDYLDRFEGLLTKLEGDVPTVIAGDFNQRIPRGRQPIRVAERLDTVLADWRIHTAGELPSGPHIDHIATNSQFVLEAVNDWPASDHLGRLSDHAGVICRLGYADHPIEGTSRGSASEKCAGWSWNTPSRQRPMATRPPTTGCHPVEFRRDEALTAELRVEIEDVCAEAVMVCLTGRRSSSGSRVSQMRR